MEYDNVSFNWMVHFPPEILQMILSKISTSALMRLSLVSKEVRVIALANVSEYWLHNEWHSMKKAHLMPNVKKFEAHLSLPSHLTYFNQLPDLFIYLHDMSIVVDDKISTYFRIPEAITKLTNLERLRLRAGYGEDSKMAGIALHCTNLTSLAVSQSIREQQLLQMTQLKEFSGSLSTSYSNFANLSNLEKLKGPLIPGIEKLPNLRVWYADTNTNLDQVAKVIRQLPNLERLSFGMDFSNREMPVELKELVHLTHLSFYCAVGYNSTGTQSDRLTDLTQLRSLHITTQAPSPMKIVSKLTWLTKLITIGADLNIVNEISMNLTQLKYFKYNSYAYYNPTMEFADQLTKLQQLETLTYCNAKIPSLENLRALLSHFKKLRRVEISCPELSWISLKELDWRPIKEVIVNYMTVWCE